MSFISSDNKDSQLIAMVATGTFAICIAYFIWGVFAKNPTKQSTVTNNAKSAKDIQKKKSVVPLTLESQIENVELRYENEFKPRIQKLLKSFDKNIEKDIYERNYCNEMLLKLLIELDGIDLVDLEPERKKILKSKRKDVIKLIQTELKLLDSLE